MSARTVDEIICCPGGDCSKGETCGAETIGPGVRAALRAAGYAVVPREPTEAMIVAGEQEPLMSDAYRSMLAAGEATP